MVRPRVNWRRPAKRPSQKTRPAVLQASIQELSRGGKRDLMNVYNDMKLLAHFGLVNLVEDGPRQSAFPVAKFSEIVLAA